jgi:hypothetical protein
MSGSGRQVLLCLHKAALAAKMRSSVRRPSALIGGLLSA